MELYELTVHELVEKLEKKEVTSEEITKSYFDRIKEKDPMVKAYVSTEQLNSIIEILSLDPRPSYQNDPERIYGMSVFGYEVKFKADGNELYVISIENC